VDALIDTNILVYRYDDRFPEKQAIVEFVAAGTRTVRGHAVPPLAEALREAEELLSQFTVLYPNEAMVRKAVRGCDSQRRLSARTALRVGSSG
jgi:hypothetical protein